MSKLKIVPDGLQWDVEQERFVHRFGKKKNRHLCQVKFCRNEASLHTNKRKRKTCHKCRSRLFRANHPELYAYHHLKDSAKKRSVRFTLTFEQFKSVIAGTGYLAKKGRSSEQLQIDRKRADAGYEFGNLRVISASHNATKGNYEKNGCSLSDEDFYENTDDPF